MGNRIFTDFYLSEAAGLHMILNIGHPELAYIEPLRINETGAFVYKLLDSGNSVDEVIKRVSSEYGISEDNAREDVTEFVIKLRDFGVNV